jgi:hypothetical protein
MRTRPRTKDAVAAKGGHDYKGHSRRSIGEERRLNPRIANKSRAEFIHIMENLVLPRPAQLDRAVPLNRGCGAIALNQERLSRSGTAELLRGSNCAARASSSPVTRSASTTATNARARRKLFGSGGPLYGAPNKNLLSAPNAALAAFARNAIQSERRAR